MAEYVIGKISSVSRALLETADADAPTASKIQYLKFQVQEQLKAVQPEEGNVPWEEGEHDWSAIQQEIISIHRYRWDYGYTCLQGTGYLLDPEYIDMEQHDDEETMDTFRLFVQKTFHPGKAPGEQAPQEEKDAYEEHCEVQLEKQANAELELMQYKNKLGVFARPVTWLNAKRMSAADFWALHGSETPNLQIAVMRAVAQVSSASSASERGHKVMNMIETKKTNRLAWETVEKLIYFKHNSAQQRKRQKLGTKQPVIEWTEGTEE
eukprot:gene24578-29892_t